jgi:hypothetical protein
MKNLVSLVLTTRFCARTSRRESEMDITERLAFLHQETGWKVLEEATREIIILRKKAGFDTCPVCDKWYKKHDEELVCSANCNEEFEKRCEEARRVRCQN